MKQIDCPSRSMRLAGILALSIFSLISTAALGRAQSVDVVYHFTSGTPIAGLIQGMDGLLYGMTQSDGVNNGGTVFKISPNGTGFNVIHSFDCAADGCNSRSFLNSTGLIQLDDGSLYGTTNTGGVNNAGTIFEISPNGTGFNVIHSFEGKADGSSPFAD